MCLKYAAASLLFSLVFHSLLLHCKTMTKKEQNVFASNEGKVWMCKDLSVLTFSNGDSLILCKNAEEWLSSCEKHIPACCCNNFGAYECNTSIFYNYWAICDKRNLSPYGWHIATAQEWEELIEYYGLNSKIGSKNISPYFFTGSSLVCENQNEISFENNGSGWYWQKESTYKARYISFIGCPPGLDNWDCIASFGALVRCVKDR